MSTDQTLRTALMSSSKFDACQGLRVDDAWDRSDLVDDDLTEDIEILGLDFRDQVVLFKQWPLPYSFFLDSVPFSKFWAASLRLSEQGIAGRFWSSLALTASTWWRWLE